MKWQIILKNGMKSHGQTIAITKNGFNFSRDFIVENNLKDMKGVAYLENPEDDYVLGFKFKKEQDEVSYRLRPVQNRDSCLTRVANAGKLLSENPILSNLRDLPVKLDKTFTPIRDEDEPDIFFINLRPSFSEKVKSYDINMINPEFSGIYQILDMNSNIIYIGSGKIKDRVLEHKKSFGDEIAEIQYSVISDRDKAYYWETSHINKHTKQYGKRPKHNKLNGRNVQSIEQEAKIG